MMKAKIGAIFLISVLMFAGIGVAYAHWEETLTISGQMHTDDIDPVFECPESNDPGLTKSLDPTDCGTWTFNPNIWHGTQYPNAPERRTKDVGSCDVIVTNEGKGLLIDINDAYPCYYSHVMYCLKNYGSCPVLVHSIMLTEISEGDNVIVLSNPVSLAPYTTYYVKIWTTATGAVRHLVTDAPDDPAKFDFSMMVTGEDLAIDTQLDPWDWGHGTPLPDPTDHTDEPYVDTLYGDLCVHFENGCSQDEDYDFKIDLVFYNWPEVN